MTKNRIRGMGERVEKILVEEKEKKKGKNTLRSWSREYSRWDKKSDIYHGGGSTLKKVVDLSI